MSKLLSASGEVRVHFSFREWGGDGRPSVRRVEGQGDHVWQGSKLFSASGKARVNFRSGEWVDEGRHSLQRLGRRGDSVRYEVICAELWWDPYGEW